jgi:hypothetical protein
MPFKWLTSTNGLQMFSYLPPDFYENDILTQAILQVIGMEFDEFQSDLLDIKNQAYAPTAEEWGLTLFEGELGLPFAGMSSVDERRSTVIAAMRGTGTITAAEMEKIADSWEFGTTQVQEIYGQGLLIVQIMDVRGVPANINDLTNALRAKKPAHLTLQINFSYFTWDKLDAHNWTWDQFDAMNFTWDQLEVAS